MTPTIQTKNSVTEADQRGRRPVSAERTQSDRTDEPAAIAGAARGHRPVTLFSVPFKSAMDDAELARLRRALDLVTYMSPRPGVSGASQGVAQLDFWSSLFLRRGAGADEWVLEGRTWGDPHDSVIHEWHVGAALAARELDATVQIPPRRPDAVAEHAVIPVGRAANKRLARLGRHLLRLG